MAQLTLERRHSFAELVRKHPVASFFIAAYVVSWSYWIPMVLLHQRVTLGGTSTHYPGLFGPMIAALLVARVAEGSDGLSDLVARMTRWRVGFGWAAVAVASPLVAFVIAAAVTRWPSWDALGVFGGIPVTTPVILWLLLSLAGIGEETGWRGFALPELERTHSPLGATLLVALAWAGWHLPTFFFLETYRSLQAPAFVGFFFGMACGAVVLTWLYHRTRNSILMVALWHGSFNLASGTLAARGSIAAIVSTLVMAGAAVLVILELRARRRGTSILERRSPCPIP